MRTGSSVLMLALAVAGGGCLGDRPTLSQNDAGAGGQGTPSSGAGGHGGSASGSGGHGGAGTGGSAGAGPTGGVGGSGAGGTGVGGTGAGTGGMSTGGRGGAGGTVTGSGGTVAGTGGTVAGAGGARGGASGTGGAGGGAGCSSGQMSCSGTCVNVATDNNHCGSCSNACTGGQQCTNSACTCPATTLNCSGTCESPTAANQCGASCTAACPAPTNGTSTGHAICTGVSCDLACNGTTPNNCSGACVNLTNDNSHCGTCTNACTGGQQCANSACACPSTTLNCSGTCQSPTPANHCGTSCTTACPDPSNGSSTGSASCSGSTCGLTCNSGTPTNCSGACVNLMTDASNCGACGHACKFSGAVCSGGICQPTPLATGQTSPSWLLTNGGAVFWIDNGSSPAVNAANENGTAYTGAAPGVDPSTPGVYFIGSFMYWINGGTTPSWVSPSFGAMPLASIPSGVAFDATANSSHLYWTNPDAAAIQAMGTDGIDQVFSPPLYGAQIPVAIAIDASNIYWTDVVGAPGSGKVSKAPLPASGAGAGPVTSIASGLSVSGGARTLAVNTTNAYFVNTVTNVVTLTEVPIGGGGTKTALATGGIVAIAADAAGVYWVDSTAGAVFQVATGTTTVTKLASSQAIQTMPGTIAVDAAGVYWATTTAIMAITK